MKGRMKGLWSRTANGDTLRTGEHHRGDIYRNYHQYCEGWKCVYRFSRETGKRLSYYRYRREIPSGRFTILHLKKQTISRHTPANRRNTNHIPGARQSRTSNTAPELGFTKDPVYGIQRVELSLKDCSVGAEGAARRKRTPGETGRYEFPRQAAAPGPQKTIHSNIKHMMCMPANIWQKIKRGGTYGELIEWGRGGRGVASRFTYVPRFSLKTIAPDEVDSLSAPGKGGV